MSCPKLKIPWPRVIGEPTPSVDHDQENWKSVERWADGILKCIPTVGDPEGIWVVGFGNDGVDLTATTGTPNTTYAATYPNQYWENGGYTYTSTSVAAIGTPAGDGRDQLYTIDFHVAMQAQATTPTVGTILGQVKLEVGTDAGTTGSWQGQYISRSEWLVATAASGTEVQAMRYHLTGLIVVPPNYYIIPTITMNAYVNLTTVKTNDSSLKLVRIGPVDDTWFPCA